MIKRSYIFAVLALILILFTTSTLFAQKKNAIYSSYFTGSEITMDKAGRSPVAIRFEEGNRPTVSSFFDEYRKAFPLSKDNEMRLWQTLPDKLGQTHYRFNQYYKGIEVIGAQYILHEENGYVRSANGRLVEGLNLNVAPVLLERQALEAALKDIGADSYMWENPANETFLKREQANPGATFYPQGELKITSGWEELLSENCSLVYRFDIYAEKPLSRYWVDIDAITGEVRNKISRIQESDVPGSGASLYNGTVNMTVDQLSPSSFRLQENTTRGAAIRTFNMNNGTNYGAATDFTATGANGPWDDGGVSGHFGAEATYDYYFNEHGRNSLNNSGMALLSYVHYSVNYVNAFWDGSRMTYGDGNGTSYGPLISLDVVGHELTHGVTEFSANLIYQKESGALNESFSDIFGNLVEFEVEGVPGMGTGNWRMGEDFTSSGAGIRNMANPNEFGDPDTYGGTYWVNVVGCIPNPNTNDNCGVHTNSGVQNFWFYLLVEGGSGTNDNGDPFNVTGIGAADAAAVAYRNLTVYLTTSSEYLDARNGSVNAATDLFGDPSQQLQSVKDAWDAVGVSEPVPPSGILVWEGQLGGQDYSGAYFNDFLTNAGFEVRYTSVFPPTLIGFDGVFLSFGNFGSGGSNTVFNSGMASAVQAYLQAGGKVYLEGGDALGYDQSGNTTLLNLFGLASATDGGTNAINGLQGQTGALTEGMLFTSSTQVNNTWIDVYTPGSGTLSFIESGYGNVAVEYSGAYGQETFCFSYALAELTDGVSRTTRDNLMAEITGYLDLAPPSIVNVKAFLEGPYSSGSMSTALSPNLPLDHPYSGAPWNHTGTESVTSIPADVVDWVLVELRSSTEASSVVGARAAFVKSDGMIVDLDGTSPVKFEIDAGDYFIVIQHRNHLSIMSAAAQAVNSSSTLYNFATLISSAYTEGSAAMKDLGDGSFGMFSSDANNDGQVTSSDFNIFLPAARTAETGYHIADWNLDGQVTSLDFNIFNPNARNAATTQVPGAMLVIGLE